MLQASELDSIRLLHITQLEILPLERYSIQNKLLSYCAIASG
jgi:hypothetical protein